MLVWVINTASSSSFDNVYDFDNKLVQRGTIAMVYDGDGNRVRKTTGGLTTNTSSIPTS